MPVDDPGELTELRVDYLGKIAMSVQKTDGDNRQMAISKTLQCISGQDSQATAVIRNFSRTMNRFFV